MRLNVEKISLSNSDLEKLVVDGDKDRIIISFVPIASHIAASYSRTTGLAFDDLQCEAVLGVVDSVNRLCSMNHRCPGGYINKYIHQYCHRFIKRFQNHEMMVEPEGRQGIDIVELKDTLDSIIKSDFERSVIKLRSEGKNDSEVGELLGVSQSYVCRIRKELFRRYNRMKNE